VYERSRIKAALTVGGLANLERSLALRPEMKDVFETSFGNTKEGIIERSAVKWVDKLNKATPLCLLHGGDDKRVSPLDALELARALQTNYRPYSLHIFQDGDHGLINRYEERMAYTRHWFDEYLKAKDVK
jgi:dipeptidyl aminopeptidase/acylaminoacyl peptidase